MTRFISLVYTMTLPDRRVKIIHPILLSLVLLFGVIRIMNAADNSNSKLYTASQNLEPSALSPTQTVPIQNYLETSWLSSDEKMSSSIAFGDADADGDLDLVVGNSESLNQLYINDGNGNFTVQDLGIDPKNTRSVAWGDADGDGDLDLAVGNANTYDSICDCQLQDGVNQIYTNEGGGDFIASNISIEAKDTRSVAWGDVDGDGDLDLVVGNWDQANELYFNDGLGNFTVTNLGTDVKSTTSVAWGDADGDGDLDLAIGNYDETNQLYVNDRFGNFTVVDLATEATSTTSVAWGDADGDGDLDLAIGNYDETNQLYVNDRFGNFTVVDLATEATSTTSVAWGDADGDGDLDLVIANMNLYGDFLNQIYINEGDNNFDTIFLTDEPRLSRSVAWGDVNGDGKLDLAVGNGVLIGEYNQLYLNKEKVSFSVFQLGDPFFDSNFSTQTVTWGDVDGDGDLDLAVGNSFGSNELHMNDGFGDFTRIYLAEANSILAWGDADGDGDLDLASGATQIYVNDSAGNLTLTDLGLESGYAESIAWGDVDGDGDLDLVVGNRGRNQLNISDGNGNFTVIYLDVEGKYTTSLALGDMDGDGDLDIVAGNINSYDPDCDCYLQDGVNQIYINNGSGKFDSFYIGNDARYTNDMDLGDIDGDGDLDVAVANVGGGFAEINQLYVNDGQGNFEIFSLSTEINQTLSIDFGDMDEDGDLDIAVGNAGEGFGEINQLYINDGQGNYTASSFIGESAPTWSVDWGDMDGDGDLDLAVGDGGTVNKVLVNQIRGASELPYTFSTVTVHPRIKSQVLSGTIVSIPYTLADTKGNSVGEIRGEYSFNGVGQWFEAKSSELTQTKVLSTGGKVIKHASLNINQPLPDLTTSVATLFITETLNIADLDVTLTISHEINEDLEVSLRSPSGTVVTLFPVEFGFAYGSHFSGTLFSDQATTSFYDGIGPYLGMYKPVGSLSDFNGEITAGEWQLQINDRFDEYSGTLVSWGLIITTPKEEHIFGWDTFASGFFGQSDNVIFRIIAHPQPPTSAVSGTFKYTNVAPFPIQKSYTSASSTPFRVRGTQVQVIDEADNPIPDAIVYQLPITGTMASVMSNQQTDQPFETDQAGYLRGRGQLEIGDQLVALQPITATNRYTVYQTSAIPTLDGLDTFTVTEPGVQTLRIIEGNTLTLYRLIVSLEWDASNDPLYMRQLKEDIQRASRYLFDLTNGQAAIGDVHIYHNKGYWSHADVIIRASNQVRPSAVLGGSVYTPTHDVDIDGRVLEDAYIPGQISMPVVWNRFGDAEGSIGEDWPRTLAHELGHYLFHLPDNYLGVKNGTIALVDCPSVMDNPYIDVYSEFVAEPEWTAECSETLAAQYFGRSDWQTMIQFYPWMRPPQVPMNPFSGPNTLPLAVTQVQFFAEPNGQPPLTDSYFTLVNESFDPVSIPQGQAQIYLIKTSDDNDPANDYIVPLGSPVGDDFNARGVAEGDRLCVLDFSQRPLRTGGCEEVVGRYPRPIQLIDAVEWEPEIVVTPISTDTVTVTVRNPYTLSSLNVRLYPAIGSPSSVVSMTPTADGWEAVVTAEEGAYYGYVHLWTPNTAQHLIVDFVNLENWGGKGFSWGNDVNPWGSQSGAWGGKGFSWGGKGFSWGGKGFSWGAPIMSGDGQVMVFPLDDLFSEGRDYALQRRVFLPDLPTWMTPVGQAYQLTRQEGFPNTSILFRYLALDVPEGYEQDIVVAYQPLDSDEWILLKTNLDTLRNHAAAAVPGQGTYVLVATLEMPPLVEGWNSFAFPVRAAQPLPKAFESIQDKYTSILHYEAATDSWLLYDTTVPDNFREPVNTLTQLEFAKAYWVYATEEITPYLNVGELLVADTYLGESESECSLQPPATYYGYILPSNEFVITAGMTITAEIDEEVYGIGTIEMVDGELIYVIQVQLPAEAGACDLENPIISFRIDEYISSLTANWQNSQANFLDLPFAVDDIVYHTYLPIVSSTDR